MTAAGNSFAPPEAAAGQGMRIVLAPDSFKESMTAATAAASMERGVARVWPGAECCRVPMADGGEGTLAVLADALGVRLTSVATTDPMGMPVNASLGISAEVAVIEVATVIGLELVPVELRDLAHATTFGLARLFAAALDAAVPRIIVGIGGTATNDGGAGLLVGLGARLLDAQGQELSPDPSGLAQLDRIDLSGLDSRLSSVQLEIASDVANPLLGPTGAVAVFATQKGARADQLPALEAGLARLAQALVVAGFADVRDRPGAGAAGGLGAALLALGGQLCSGAELVMAATGLEAAVVGADLVLTGEGSLDSQTAFGKAISAVLAVAGSHQVPVIGFAGRIEEPQAVAGLGFAQVYSILPEPMELTQALAHGPELLESAVVEALQRWSTDSVG